EAARAKLSSSVSDVPVQSGGLQTVRWYLIGRICLVQRRPELSMRQADLILRTPDTGLQISDLLQAGALYARAGNMRAARRALVRMERAWRAGPSSWKRSSLKNLEGEILLAEHRPQQAETAFLAADPPFRSYVGLARVYEA